MESGGSTGEHQGGSVRVVKESDSKSDGLCPHRFESCGPRSFGTNWSKRNDSQRCYTHINRFISVFSIFVWGVALVYRPLQTYGTIFKVHFWK